MRVLQRPLWQRMVLIGFLPVFEFFDVGKDLLGFSDRSL